MTIWLDGQTGGSSQNKAECFDSVTVNCATGLPPPLCFVSVVMLPQHQVRLMVSGQPGSSVRMRRSSDLVTWLVLTNLVNTNGTMQFSRSRAISTTSSGNTDARGEYPKCVDLATNSHGALGTARPATCPDWVGGASGGGGL
jgi:hypothetical protein